MKLALLLLLTATLTNAQAPKPTDLSQVFEPEWNSEKARLFRVTLPPAQATQAVGHDRDWMLVTLSTGDVTLSPEKARSRRIEFQPGHIEISTTASPTVIRNSSSAAVIFYLIELAGGIRDDAAACGLGGAECDSEYGDMSGPTYARSTEFDTPTVRAIETTIDPQATLDPHEHPFPFLMIALSDLELESRVEGKPPDTIALKSGEYRAFDAGLTHVIKNTGKAPARFVTLEMK